MFKAIKKGKSGNSETKGTLAALWSKKAAPKEGSPSENAPDNSAPAPGGEPAGSPAPEHTPAPEPNAPATAGPPPAEPPAAADTAITAAVPDPSPEPAKASAAVAAAVAQPASGSGKAVTPAAPAAAAPVSAGPASGAGADKKRKRGRPAAKDLWSEEQRSALAELFAQGEYPSGAAKAAVAAQTGLEPAQVDKWFQKERKRVREETGAPPKRGGGRPKASGGAGAGAAPASGEEAGGVDAAEAAADATAEAAAVGGAAAEMMDVDAPTPGPDAAEPAQQQQQQQQQQPAGPAIVPQVAAEAPQPINAADAAAPAAAKPAAQQEQAAEASPTEQPAAAAPAAPASRATLASAAAQPGAATKTPATAAPTVQHTVSAEEKEALIAQLEGEAAELQARGLAAPLHALPAAAAAAAQDGDAAVEAPERVGFSEARLAEWLVGQRAPLSRLAAALLPLFKVSDSEAPLEPAVLNSHIVNLAARKSHGPKDGGSALMNALEDDAPGHLWQWELRDLKVLPKEARPAAQAAKRRAAHVQERLGAVSAALHLLGGHPGGKASAKLAKALDALQKAKTLAQVEAEEAAEQEAAAAKAAAKKAASASKPGVTAEDKARQKEAKIAKKAGVKDTAALKKQQGFMSMFVKAKPPAAAGTSCAAAAGPSPDRATHGGASQQTSQAGTASQQTRQRGGDDATATKGKKREMAIQWKPADPATLHWSAPLQPSTAGSMDAAAGQPFSVAQVQTDWQALLQGMKWRRREAAAQARPLGLPPSWQRKRDGVQVAQRHADRLQESGADLSALRTWRRKLIYFGGDSQRPPYYGSHAPSAVVRPRRYLAQDEVLDYEEMSDLDWEEEPADASSLSDAEDEASEMPGGEEEEEQDSFICEDGYLSEDEGVQMDDLEDGTAAMPLELPEGAAAAAGIDPQRLLSMQQLDAQMDRARRAGKPLIISRLPTPAGADAQANNNNGVIQGDASLLAALAAEVLLPGARVGVPEDLAVELAGGAPATAPKSAAPVAAAAGGSAKPSGPGRPRFERPTDLLPDLLRLVQAEPTLQKGKIAERFIAAHPGRSIPKKWVEESLREHADFKGTKRGWVLRPAALVLLAEVPPAPADGGAPTTDAAAAGGVQPTPAAAPTGGMDRFLFKGVAGTPAVPSALRPNAPPSEFKAPGRLVTTTAAGASAAAADSPLPPLALPGRVEGGTSDPFWRRLVQHIEAAEEGGGGGGTALPFEAAFEAAPLACLVASMPANILTVLVSELAAPGAPLARRTAVLRSLAAAVAALAAAEAKSCVDSLTASQQVWQDRGAPLAASLSELCREPGLEAGLAACVEAARGGGDAALAASAAAVAGALVGSEACQAALAEAGAGLRVQLEAALAAAAAAPAPMQC